MVEGRKLDAIVAVLAPRIGVEAPITVAGPHMDAKERSAYKVEGKIAVIDVSGSLVNRMDADALSAMTNYEQIGDELLEAGTNSKIGAIVLRFDSFGGEVSGCFDLAALIADVRQQKPVYAAVDDFAFSAAYLLASACDKVFVSQTAGVGSIGVRAMHVDYSAYNEKMGVKPTTIFAGARKNDLSPDEPLADEARDVLQAEIDRIYGMFAEAVATARGMSVSSIKATEAGLYYGVDAVKAGLADEVLNFRGVMSLLAGSPEATNAPKSSRMVTPAEITTTLEASVMDTSVTPVPAASVPSPPQIDALQIADLCAIAGMDNRLGEFLRAKLTVEQVREQLLAARAEAGDKAGINSNHAGLAQTVAGAISAAAARMSASNPALTKQQAYTAAMHENPALYDQYLAANPAQTGGR
jgi:signal peptide peptidase SppA